MTDSDDLVRHLDTEASDGWSGDAACVSYEYAKKLCDRIQELEREKAAEARLQQSMTRECQRQEAAKAQANTEADMLADLAMMLWKLWAIPGAAANAVSEDYRKAIAIATRRTKETK